MIAPTQVGKEAVLLITSRTSMAEACKMDHHILPNIDAENARVGTCFYIFPVLSQLLSVHRITSYCKFPHV